MPVEIPHAVPGKTVREWEVGLEIDPHPGPPVVIRGGELAACCVCTAATGWRAKSTGRPCSTKRIQRVAAINSAGQGTTVEERKKEMPNERNLF